MTAPPHTPPSTPPGAPGPGRPRPRTSRARSQVPEPRARLPLPLGTGQREHRDVVPPPPVQARRPARPLPGEPRPVEDGERGRVVRVGDGPEPVQGKLPERQVRQRIQSPRAVSATAVPRGQQQLDSALCPVTPLMRGCYGDPAVAFIRFPPREARPRVTGEEPGRAGRARARGEQGDRGRNPAVRPLVAPVGSRLSPRPAGRHDGPPPRTPSTSPTSPPRPPPATPRVHAGCPGRSSSTASWKALALTTREAAAQQVGASPVPGAFSGGAVRARWR